MDREEAKLLITFYLLVLFLSAHKTTAQEDGSSSGGTQSTTADACPLVHAVVVHNSSEGTKVQYSSITSSTTERNTVTLPGVYIPEVCGHNRQRCNIKAFEHNSTEVYCVIPVRNSTNNGAVIMKFLYNDEMDLEFEDYFFVTISKDCIPTQTFVTDDSIIMACLNLSLGNSYVQFFPLRLDDINDISTAFFFDTFISEQIYSPETLSPFVLGVDHRRRCGSRDNIYFVDDPYVVYYAADIHVQQFEYPPPLLRDCHMYSSVEYHDNDKLIIRCSNDSAFYFDPCHDTSVERYTASTSGLPYPCPNSDTLVLLKDGRLTVTNATSDITVIDLPSADIELAACFGESDPAFVVTLKNGSTYVLWLTDEHLQYLVDSSHTHYYQVFSGDIATDNAIGIATESDLVVVNLTCRYSPVSHQLPLQFHPDMLTLFLGRSAHPCECVGSLDPTTEPTTEPTTDPTTEPTTEPTTNPTTTQVSSTDPIVTTAATVPPSNTSNVPQVENTDNKDSETLTTNHILGIIVAVVVLFTSVVCIVLGVGYVWKKCRHNRDYSIIRRMLSSRRSSISTVESYSIHRIGQRESELRSLRGESPNEVEDNGDTSVDHQPEINGDTDHQPEIQTEPRPPIDTEKTSTTTYNLSTEHAETSEEDQSHSTDDQPRTKAFLAQGASPWQMFSESPMLEPAESTLYMTPISESGRGERDVAVSHRPVMPPDMFHATAVVQQIQCRTETQEKTNDFISKRNAF